MGIQGLTTFIDDNPYLLTDYRLHDCRVVIDGNNLYHFLYYYFNINVQYAGDYNLFAECVKYFFGVLSECGIKPVVVFDGGHDVSDRKLATILRRSQERIHLASLLSHGRRGRVLPILTCRTFIRALNELDISHLTCDLEADEDIAALAHSWNCPVMSNDSDFFIFDLPAGFVLLDYLNLEVCCDELDDSRYKFINVQRYHIDSLLNKFPAMERSLVALFATLQGNDYIDRQEFLPFYSKVTVKTAGKNRHGNKPRKHKLACSTSSQNKITFILSLLQTKGSFTDAVDYVMSFIPDVKKEHVRNMVLKSVESYTQFHSNVLGYLDKHPATHSADSSSVMPSGCRMQSYLKAPLPAWFVTEVRSGQKSFVDLVAEKVPYSKALCITKYL